MSFLSGLLRFRPRPGEVPCQQVVDPRLLLRPYNLLG